MSKDTTLYIVAYDLPSDRRRAKLHRLLKGFGTWTQFSIFECWLSDAQLVKLRARLDKLLKESEDSVRVYPLCAGCVRKVETIGSAKPQEDEIYVV